MYFSGDGVPPLHAVMTGSYGEWSSVPPDAALYLASLVRSSDGVHICRGGAQLNEAKIALWTRGSGLIQNGRSTGTAVVPQLARRPPTTERRSGCHRGESFAANVLCCAECISSGHENVLAPSAYR